MWRRAPFALALVPLLVMLVSCASGGSAAAPSRVVYGLTLAPSGIDPHVDVSSELGIPLTSVYDTLVYLTDDGRFVPGLAESWDISADGTAYTFRLKHGVVFHDGTPFNAAAVQRTLQRVADPATMSRRAATMLGPFVSCDVVDTYTVRIVLSAPFAPLLDSLSQVYLAPASPTALDKWGADYQLHQVGTGPYMMREYVPKDHLILVRNPDYAWGPEGQATDGAATVEEIEFRFLVEPSVRLPALEAGDVDVVGELPPLDAARAAASEDMRLQPVAIAGVPLLGFFNVTNPPTDDPLVRQALILATDRQSLVTAVFGAYSPVAAGPLSHSHTYFDGSLDGAYAYDPAQAAALLDQSGWLVDAATGMRSRDGQPLRIEAYVMSWGMVPEVSQWLQAQWREVGVDLVINEATLAAMTAAAAENRHNLIFWTEAGTDPDVLRTFFHSRYVGQRNWANVRSAELDALLDAGAREGDTATRLGIYRDVQQLVMQEALVLPIRDYVNLNGSRACVLGLTYDSHGWNPVLHDLSVDGECR
ncbi:MAG: ABC transporter substrate-binding protein [Anaerolineae bacterium]